MRQATDGGIFDSKANGYDVEFSQSYIGKFQRRAIHEFLMKELNGRENLNILELNCGTGDDAVFLQQFGTVKATDVSIEMLKVASNKYPKIEFELLDLNKPISTQENFDLIFSNFGGMNCIARSRLQALNNELAEILNPGGRLVMVLMHKWSFVELIYFLIKLEFKKAFRRLYGQSEYGEMNIYYYSKSGVMKTFNSFRLKSSMPIGVVLSGEYMNSIGQQLELNDKAFKCLSPVLGADHYLFNFIKKD